VFAPIATASVKSATTVSPHGVGDQNQSGMFSYFSPDERVGKERPLRAIRTMVDKALREMSPLFDETYSEIGRQPSGYHRTLAKAWKPRSGPPSFPK
jgi:hypothetical protein